MRKILVFLLIPGLSFLMLQASGQTQGVLGKRFIDNWSVGLGGGPNIFFGDLKEQEFLPVTSDMNELKFGGTFTITRQLSHVFAIRGQLLYSEISGTKREYSGGSPCNEYFIGNILEGNINTTINFSNLFSSRYKPKRKFFVYGTLGLGISNWITTVKNMKTDEIHRKSNDNDQWRSAPVAMGGIGAYYNFGDKVNLGIEWNLHGVNSDYVDATKGIYRYDAYSMVALQITYNFNKFNPGKEPDTNLNKIYVPVYVQQPAPASKPVDSTPPPVKIAPVDDLEFTDTIGYQPMLTYTDPDEDELFAEIPDTGEYYRVQILALRNDRLTVEIVKEKHRITEDLFIDYADGWYRYTVGNCSTLEEARQLKSAMRAKGFRDAFITRFTNGERIPVFGK